MEHEEINQISTRTKILSTILLMLFLVGIFIITDTHEVDERLNSDIRYMVGLNIETAAKFGNTTFLVYDGDVLVESDNVSRTIFREDTQDYQYVCYCDRKNWTYAKASTFRFVWYDVDNDRTLMDITATPALWSDCYGHGNYFIWLDRYERSVIILARIN